MWQLPTWEQSPVSRHLQGDASSAGKYAENTRVALQTTANKELCDWFKERFGLNISSSTQAADFTHQTTHRTIRFVVLHATIKSGRLNANTGVWRKPEQTDDLPMSNPQRKATHSILKPQEAN